MINLRKLARGVIAASVLGLTCILAQHDSVSAHDVQRGQASFYSNYYNGRRMSNGQKFYNNSNSCAHRTLRFGTVVNIRNTRTGRRATCVVRDRGPFVGGRVIDLSQSTFSQIAPLSQGVANVEISW
jgi:rare lipoprotein A